MAGLAQGHHGVLTALLDVVGVTWARSITDAAGKLLDPTDVLTLRFGQAVVHIVTLSIALSFAD